MAGFFSHFSKSKFDLVSREGGLKGAFEGLFQKTSLSVSNIEFDADPGDEIRRKLPNGKDEVFEVLATSFQDAFHGIEAHFNVDIRKKGIMEPKTGGNYFHISGPNARVIVNSEDNSTNTYGTSSPIYSQVREAISQVKNVTARENAVAALEKMQNASDDKSRVSGFQSLVKSLADDMTVIIPFIPQLTALLGLGGGT